MGTDDDAWITVVSTEADGQAGLAAALRGEHDVIVLDVMLPALNGLDVCRMLRSQRVSTPEHRGETLSRETLLADVWGYDDTPLTRTVDVHVAGLRQKLETNPKQPEYLVTMHGLGYKFTG